MIATLSVLTLYMGFAMLRSAAYPAGRPSRGSRLSPVCARSRLIVSQRELDYYIVRQFRRCRYRQRRLVYNYFETGWSHQNKWFQVWFVRTLTGSGSSNPSPDPFPRFFLGFSFVWGFALDSLAPSAFDSGFALDCSNINSLHDHIVQSTLYSFEATGEGTKGSQPLQGPSDSCHTNRISAISSQLGDRYFAPWIRALPSPFDWKTWFGP